MASCSVVGVSIPRSLVERPYLVKYIITVPRGTQCETALSCNAFTACQICIWSYNQLATKLSLHEENTGSREPKRRRRKNYDGDQPRRLTRNRRPAGPSRRYRSAGKYDQRSRLARSESGGRQHL